MADQPMIINDRDNDNGFGGGLGTGLVGGILGGLLFGGGYGGWGNRGNFGVGAGSAYDAGMLQGISNQITHANDAATQGTIASLQNANSTQQFVGSKTDALMGAIATANVNTNQTLQNISDKLCCINNNITAQSGQTRELAQGIAMQLQQQHADLKATIIDQGCQDRALMKEIQTQAIRDKLDEVQTQNAALQNQINLTNQLTSQTAYLVQQLKPTTTTTGA